MTYVMSFAYLTLEMPEGVTEPPVDVLAVILYSRCSSAAIQLQYQLSSTGFSAGFAILYPQESQHPSMSVSACAARSATALQAHSFQWLFWSNFHALPKVWTCSSFMPQSSQISSSSASVWFPSPQSSQTGTSTTSLVKISPVPTEMLVPFSTQPAKRFPCSLGASTGSLGTRCSLPTVRSCSVVSPSSVMTYCSSWAMVGMTASST